MNPDSYLTHKWYAIVAGRATDFMSINEKVRVGFEFKDHLDIAIKMNDSDYLLYYLRGRWTFKVGSNSSLIIGDSLDDKDLILVDFVDV